MLPKKEAKSAPARKTDKTITPKKASAAKNTSWMLFSVGAHRTVMTPFPKWVPAEAMTAAEKLDAAEALVMIAPFVP